MMLELRQGQRVDWCKLIDDLRRAGLGFKAVSEGTGIPFATLAGYKNLDVEPKHADGTVLIALWGRRHSDAAVPVMAGSVRRRPRY